MNELVKYEDGKLTIPLPVVKKYWKSIDTMLKSFKNNVNTEDEVSNIGIQYKGRDDYISLRIFDGELVPYVEIFSKSQSYVDIQGKTSMKHAYMMKTFVGTIPMFFTSNILINSDTNTGNVFLDYEVTSIKVLHRNKVAKQIADFPKFFWDSYSDNKDLVMNMTSDVYQLISVTSVKTKKMQLYSHFIVDGESLKNFSIDLPKQQISGSSVNSKKVVVTYAVNPDKLKCLNAIATELHSAKDVDNTRNNIEIILHHETSEKVISSLMKLKDVNFRDGSECITQNSVILDLPTEFSLFLSTKFNLTKSAAEIMIGSGELLAMDEYMNDLFEECMCSFNVEQKKAIMPGCLSYLNSLDDQFDCNQYQEQIE